MEEKRIKKIVFEQKQMGKRDIERQNEIRNRKIKLMPNKPTDRILARLKKKTNEIYEYQLNKKRTKLVL